MSSFIATASAGPTFKRPPYEHVSSVQIQPQVEPGEYWCIKRDGEDWPVVICDEEIVQKFFKGKKRPENARQADGNWGKDFKAGGKLVGQRCYPAIHPGTLELCWPGSKVLEPFHADIGKAIRESTTNRCLAKSWEEALSCEDEGVSISYWKGRLIARAKDSSNKDNQEKELSGNRKRKGTPEFKMPPGYSRDEGDDDEGKGLFLSPTGSSWPRIKQETNESTESAEIDALYEDPDPPYPRRSSESSKRSKLDVAGKFTLPSTKPPKFNERSNRATPMAQKLQQSSSSALHTRSNGLNSSSPMARDKSRPTPSLLEGKSDNEDPSKVMIYVGNPHKKFRAKRSGLNASPLLSSLATYHPENGWYLMSPMLSSLDPGDFFPIGQYLERGEYDPNILDEGTDWVRLERDLTDYQRGQEIIRCGTIYSTAQMLELPGLQDLAFRKLKALSKSAILQPFAILCVIELVFASGREDLRQYLVRYFADNYWEIVLGETVKAAEVMRGDEELAKGVFQTLSEESGTDWTQGKTEQKEEVKTEHQEDNGASTKGPAARADSGATIRSGSKEAETARTGMTQTEEEMIRMALRQSDEQATEEELTKMMQNQSRFFEAY